MVKLQATQQRYEGGVSRSVSRDCSYLGVAVCVPDQLLSVSWLSACCAARYWILAGMRLEPTGASSSGLAMPYLVR